MITVQVSNLDVKLSGLESAAKDLTPAWLQTVSYTEGVTQDLFRRLAHGGTYRGVRWKWFAPQYTRKTDGVTVPAEGGVPKLRGRGLVKGKMRPSGKRVTRNSNLMQDTGAMRGQSSHNWDYKPHRLTGTVKLPYAAKQHSMRPFWFWEHPKDTTYIRQAIGDHVVGRKRDVVAPRGSLLAALRSSR